MNVEILKLSRNLVPGAKGEWVRREDYKALEAERDAARAEVKALRSVLFSAYEELEKQLKEETQRTILWRKDCEGFEEDLRRVDEEREAAENKLAEVEGEVCVHSKTVKGCGGCFERLKHRAQDFEALRAAVEAEVEEYELRRVKAAFCGDHTAEHAWSAVASRLSSILEGKG